MDNVLWPATGVKQHGPGDVQHRRGAAKERLVDPNGLFTKGGETNHSGWHGAQFQRASLSISSQRLWVEAAANEALVRERVEPLRPNQQEMAC